MLCNNLQHLSRAGREKSTLLSLLKMSSVDRGPRKAHCMVRGVTCSGRVNVSMVYVDL